MPGSRLVTLITLVIMVLTLFIPVSAQDMSTKNMLVEIDNRLRNYTAKLDAIEAGQQRTVLCQTCHGEDGNAAKSDVPNLAGQNARYLLEQIDRFSDGRRIDFVMNQLVENLSAEDKINVAIYYTSMPVKQQHVNWHLANKGEALYKSRCTYCHGEEGLGQENLARIAGQQIEYVKKTLGKYRNAAKVISSPSESLRISQSMERVTRNLTDEQIEQLAHFVAQLGFQDND